MHKRMVVELWPTGSCYNTRNACLTGFGDALSVSLHTDHKARYQGVQCGGRACFRPTARMESDPKHFGPQQGMKLTEYCTWTFTSMSDVIGMIGETEHSFLQASVEFYISWLVDRLWLCI